MPLSVAPAGALHLPRRGNFIFLRQTLAAENFIAPAVLSAAHFICKLIGRRPDQFATFNTAPTPSVSLTTV